MATTSRVVGSPVTVAGIQVFPDDGAFSQALLSAVRGREDRVKGEKRFGMVQPSEKAAARAQRWVQRNLG